MATILPGSYLGRAFLLLLKSETSIPYIFDVRNATKVSAVEIKSAPGKSHAAYDTDVGLLIVWIDENTITDVHDFDLLMVRDVLIERGFIVAI